MSRPRLTRAALRREARKLGLELAQTLIGLLELHGLWDDAPGAGRASLGDDAAAHDSEAGDAHRVRRSAELLDTWCERIVGALRHERAPIAISALARRLGASPREIFHPLVLLVARGLVSKSGTRRGTRYALKLRRPARAKQRARTTRPARAHRSVRTAERSRKPVA
jgi:hypothetical protein